MKNNLAIVAILVMMTGAVSAQSVAPAASKSMVIDNKLREGEIVIDAEGSGHCSLASLKLLETAGHMNEHSAVQMLYYYPSKAQDILDAAIDAAKPTPPQPTKPTKPLTNTDRALMRVEGTNRRRCAEGDKSQCESAESHKAMLEGDGWCRKSTPYDMADPTKAWEPCK